MAQKPTWQAHNVHNEFLQRARLALALALVLAFFLAPSALAVLIPQDALALEALCNGFKALSPTALPTWTPCSNASRACELFWDGMQCNNNNTQVTALYELFATCLTTPDSFVRGQSDVSWTRCLRFYWDRTIQRKTEMALLNHFPRQRRGKNGERYPESSIY